MTRKLVASLLVAGVFLGVLELTARIAYPAREDRTFPLVPHPVLNHTWRPGLAIIIPGFPAAGIGPYRHHYNRQGWLSETDVPLARPPHTFRVMYVGDSFTAGTCPMDQTVPSRVERRLKAALAPRGWDAEVVNTGTSSYSPVLYNVLIGRVLLGYAPDLIVIDVDMTDVFDDFLYRETAVFLPDGNVAACPPGSPLRQAYVRTADGLARKPLRLRLHDLLAGASRFFAVVSEQVAAVRGREEEAAPPLPRDPALPGLYDWCEAEWSARTESQVRASMATLAAAVRSARGRGIPVVVTAVPHLEHFTGRFSRRPLGEVERTARAAGALYLDSFQALEARLGGADPGSLYIPRDMHFNLRGYELWGDAQAEYLLDPANRLLPP